MLQGVSVGWFNHSSGLNWDIQLAILLSRRFCFPGLPELCPLATISSHRSHFPVYFSCNIFSAGARTQDFMHAKHRLFHWATSISKENLFKNQTKCDWGLLSQLLKQPLISGIVFPMSYYFILQVGRGSGHRSLIWTWIFRFLGCAWTRVKDFWMFKILRTVMQDLAKSKSCL